MNEISVKTGDTLSGIALSLWGDAARWPELWAENERELRQEQRRRGLKESPDWIFPGQVLRVPN